MAMQEEKNAIFISQRRRVRINRIKKSIKWIIVLGILIPTIFSIILLFKVTSLHKSVDELENKWISILEKNKQIEEIPMAKIEDEKTPDYLDFEDIGVTDQEQLAFVNPVMQVEEILPSSTRKVYLTFDDGPSANSNEILDILDEYDVKATFFVVGKEEEQFKQVYKRIVEEGHTLGLHSYSHEYDEIYVSAEDFLSDFWKESDFVYELTGKRPFCYRFPGGSSTTKMKQDFEVFSDCLEDCNIQYYDWNVSSKDASVITLTKEQIVLNVTSSLANHKTAIILFHDAYGKQSTVDALPEIIEYIQDMENTVLLPISIGTEQIHQK
jgi:peptidoglycan/xylan/chitin deacetylase (PgdA/CDA1 family)